ncbi:MAG: ABC transporter permease subunit [Eubacteriales bacterium]|nr:ABC transporter permease subunit [Eubacteriales bacterium]
MDVFSKFVTDKVMGTILAALGLYIVLAVIFAVLNVVGNWIINKKAGRKSWAALVPVYSDYVQAELAWHSFAAFWIAALALVSVVLSVVLKYVPATTAKGEAHTWGVILRVIYLIATFTYLVLNIIKNVKLGKAFGKGIGFCIGLVLFTDIFRIILAFDKKAEYKQPHVDSGKIARYVELAQSYAMVSFTVIGVIVFVAIPLIWVVRFCLFKYKGYGSIKYVGLDNFVRVFTRTPKYWLSVKNTFVFAIGKLAVEIPLALVTAFVLTRKIKFRNFFRAMYFMPSMISVAIMGVVFNYLFAHVGGVVNEFIKVLGGQPVMWFSSGTTAMLMLMIASIWQNFGLNMLFFMTGLQSIDPAMYEAATVDGASNTKQFFAITIPLLGPVLQMVLMNAILGSLKVTDLVLTFTNGQPSGKTEVMMSFIYKAFFGNEGGAKDFGFGAALTVVTAVILGIVTIIYLKTTKKSGDVY